MYGDGPLTTYGALALASSYGTRITLATFRGYVSNGDAPAPERKVGRHPLWNQEEVREWASGLKQRRGKVAEPEAPGHYVPEILEHFSPDHFDLDEERIQEMSEAELIFHVYNALPRLIGNLEGSADRYERVTQDRLEKINGLEELPTGMSVAALWTWIIDSRKIRASRNELEAIYARHSKIIDLLNVAKLTYSKCALWLESSQSWSRWTEMAQREAKEAKVLEDWWSSLDAEAAEWTSRIVRTQDYALEDPRRVSYVLELRRKIGEYPAWSRMNDEQRTAVPENKLVLDGADFGYRWEVPGWSGVWRLGWIERSGELYLERRLQGAHGSVLPLISTPAQGEGVRLDEVMDWLAPFERVQSQRGALGLLLREIAEQEKMGWPSLVRADNFW